MPAGLLPPPGGQLAGGGVVAPEPGGAGGGTFWPEPTQPTKATLNDIHTSQRLRAPGAIPAQMGHQQNPDLPDHEGLFPQIAGGSRKLEAKIKKRRNVCRLRRRKRNYR